MRKNPFKIFNVNEFKKWMEDSSEDTTSKSAIGCSVSSNISFKKLKIVSEVLDCEKALIEFHKKGGVVIEEDGKQITVKTKKGCLKIERSHTSIN